MHHYRGDMKAHRALLVPLAALAAMLALTTVAAPASADPVSSAATTLATGPIYLDPGVAVDGKKIVVDTATITAAFGSFVKVAVIPAGTSTADAVSTIHSSLPGSFALAVFSGNNFDAGSNGLCAGFALSSLRSAVSAHVSQLRAGQYTDALVAWAKTVTTTHDAAAGCGTSGTGTTGSSAAAGSGKSSGSTAWVWLVGLAGAAAVGLGALVSSRRRRTKREVSEAKANVMPYYDRLAGDVNSLNPGDNATARQALADAAERYTSAGSQMSTATTVAQWAAVRRTALEGLQAAQTAREALGLPKGPELPPIAEPQGEQLTQAQAVTVQGQQFQGYPSYTPGAPYYFGGGGGYAGGWYNSPFWETMLIGSVIGGGGWGWGGGGGGYGAGYDNGYQAGENSSNAGNGGGFGGGDFGGGGGGWGGGDFGGGGGGFGGGDFGGGGGGGDGGSF